MSITYIAERDVINPSTGDAVPLGHIDIAKGEDFVSVLCELIRFVGREAEYYGEEFEEPELARADDSGADELIRHAGELRDAITAVGKIRSTDFTGPLSWKSVNAGHVRFRIYRIVG